MIFRKQKKTDEKVRMALSASSLFIPEGSVFSTSDPKEAGKIIIRESPSALIFIPSEDVLFKPRSWVSALSHAPFVVIIGDDSLKPYKTFMSFIDNVVFSPVPKRLSSAFITLDRDKAIELSKAAAGDGGIMTLFSVER